MTNTRSTPIQSLSQQELVLIDAYWRAANYLSVGQIYLLDNPLLRDALPDRDFDALFTADKPVIFAYHGYPSLIHRLIYRRTNHHNVHVRGYKEEGTTTTPCDMVMLNDLDRFHLAMDVIDRVPSLGGRAATLRRQMSDARLAARAYTRDHGEDDPAIANWMWPTPPGQE